MDIHGRSVAFPQRILYTGARCPRSGWELSGRTTFLGGEIAEAVEGAIEAGYRHLDCAAVYGNEDRIGAAIRASVRRSRATELWITSKLWNDKHSRRRHPVRAGKSLADLRLDYLDMYLVHWPFPNFHPPGCSVESRSPDAQPYIHEAS